MRIHKQLLRAIALSSIAVITTSLSAQTPDVTPAAVPATQPGGATSGITRVNIHMQQAVPEDIFAELSKQSGVKFTPNGNLWDQDALQTPLDIDESNVPFWSAVKDICSKTGISMQPNYGMSNARRIMIQRFDGQPREFADYPAVEASGLLVQARSFNRQQNIDYGQKQNSQNYCSVQLMVYIDPAMHVQTFQGSAKADTAVDDAGNSLVADKNNNMFYGDDQQRSLIRNCQVPLKYPDHPGKKITDLKCVLSMRVGEKMDSLVVDKPLEATESAKAFGDVTITFQSMKKNGSNYEAKVSITRDEDRNGNSNGWSILQAAQLLDAKGRPLTYSGGGGGGGANGVEQYTINYSSGNNGNDDDRAGAPTKWVIELPSQTHQLKIPVEFKDLPLPQ